MFSSPAMSQSPAAFELYYAPNSCALATHIVLEEVGARYTAVRLDLGKAEQRSPEYLALNPKGRVPALVTDRGVLTETPAMLVFVAQCFPDAELAPMNDAFVFAQMQAFNSYLCSTLHVAHAHRMRGYRWVDADDAHSIAAMRRKVPESVGACFDLIERELSKGPWVMGEHYTICDAYLFTVAQWLEADGVEPVRVPRVVEHRQRVSERAAVQRAIAAEQ